MTTAAYIQEWRRQNPEKTKAYDRKRAGNPKRVGYFKKRRKRLGRQLVKKRDEWYAKHPLAKKAHAAVYAAVKSGKLVKPKNCQGCGKEKPLHAHHVNYLVPLDVMWLCFSCHRLEHLK
jgi:hypothetical protein